MFIKTQRKVLIILNSHYLTIFICSKRKFGFLKQFHMFSFHFGLVKVILRNKKKHKSEPFLGSFLAIAEPNQIMTIFFSESLAPLYCKKKNQLLVLDLFFNFGHILHQIFLVKHRKLNVTLTKLIDLCIIIKL